MGQNFIFTFATSLYTHILPDRGSLNNGFGALVYMEVVMDQGRGSEAWKMRTRLAQDIKAMVDIVLGYYEPEIYAGLGLVMRFGGLQISLKHNEESRFAKDKGGVLRIDYMEKIEVKKRDQQVKDKSGRYLYDLHDPIT